MLGGIAWINLKAFCLSYLQYIVKFLGDRYEDIWKKSPNFCWRGLEIE